MSKSKMQMYNNLFSAMVYVILAMLICVYLIGTSIFKFALFLACVMFFALIAMYSVQKRVAIEEKEIHELQKSM